ncbi:MAG: restriction endonuclease subunit S [Cardiobacteriaceae bacterium]|nr:restriction endonuclease subunit S [Cardiobacteriaceae bacterium]
MYNQNINILGKDALSDIKEIKNNKFQILIANPPYSVKGFLSTLTQTEREAYELSNIIGENLETNNAIECFFIERASQILSENAVAGIIVPSSLINKNGEIYKKTREILLRNFQIIAISEFGNKTFGQTGTNTVVLFLRKFSQNPSLFENLKARSEHIFNGVFNDTYDDKNDLEKYCEFMDYDFDEFINFIRTGEFIQNEIFDEYKAKIQKSGAYKTLAKKKTITQDELDKFIKDEIIETEKEKFIYFMLIHEQKTLISKSPSDNKEQSKFLGYEWSNRKGSEGIKYLNQTISDDEDELTENSKALQSINTALYDPNENPNNENSLNQDKLNFWIRENFAAANEHRHSEFSRHSERSEETIHSNRHSKQSKESHYSQQNEAFRHSERSEESHNITQSFLNLQNSQISKFARFVNLRDCIDFKKAEFDLAINLSAQSKIEIVSKYPLVKLGDTLIFIKNGKNVNQINEVGKYKVSRIETIANAVVDTNAVKYTNNKVKDEDFFDYGDIILSHINSLKHLGKTAIFTSNEKIIHGINILRLKPNRKIILPFYLFAITKINYFRNEVLAYCSKAVNQSSINITNLKNIKIPLPPLDIQKQIVDECESVDNEVLNLNSEIAEFKKQSNKLLEKAFENITNQISLNSKEFEIGIGKRVLAKQMNENAKIPVYSANVFEPFGYIDELLITDFSKTSVLWGIDGDWQVNTIKANLPFYPTDHCGVLRVKNGIINEKLLAYALEIQGRKFEFSRSKRASIDRIKSIKIPLPPIEVQEQIVAEFEKLENEIAVRKQRLEALKNAYNEILDKYLK